MTKDEALRLALEFIPSISPAFICEASHHKKHEQHASNEPCPHVAKQKQVYEAIKAALEAKDEPVSQPKVRTGNCLRVGVCASEGHKIQPQRTWVGLTQDELNMIGDRMILWNSHSLADVYVAIEAKLKEKNT